MEVPLLVGKAGVALVCVQLFVYYYYQFYPLIYLRFNLINLKIFSSNMGFGLTKYGCNLMGRS
jgi:hypothetical protein